jgi:hypothetical protein
VVNFIGESWSVLPVFAAGAVFIMASSVGVAVNDSLLKVKN